MTVSLLVVVAATTQAQTLRPRPSVGVPELSITGADSAWTDLRIGLAVDNLVKPLSDTNTLNADDQQALADRFAEAARFARDEPDALIAALRARATERELVSVASRHGYERAKHAAVATIALNREPSVLDAVLRKVSNQDLGQRIQRDAEAIRRAIAERRSLRPVAALFADGSVRNAVSGDSANPGAATGSIGVAVTWPSGFAASVSVAVASSIDTIKAGFGGVILTPGSGRGNLSNFLVDGRTPHIALFRRWANSRKPAERFFTRFPWVGIHAYATGSNSLWRRVLPPETTVTGTTTTITQDTIAPAAVVVGYGVGFYRDFLTHRLLNTPVRLTGEILWGKRLLRGNIRSDSAAVTEALNGLNETRFTGMEYGLQLTIGAVSAGVQYYSIRGRARSIANLGGGQLVIGLSVAGNIIAGPLDLDP